MDVRQKQRLCFLCQLACVFAHVISAVGHLSDKFEKLTAKKNLMDRNKIMLKMDIESDISRIENILTSGIFDVENSRHPLKNAAFIELMVCLNDLLQKAKDLNVPVAFTDDIPSEITRKDGNSINITDFVSMVRNAVCHIPSGTHFLIESEEHQIKSTFIIIRGKVDSLIMLGGEPLIQSLYEDDFCFNFGKLVLYYKRHILRSFVEARNNVLPLISSDAFFQ